MDVTYCPKCAARLVRQFSGDRARPTCPSCGFVFYFNPVVGAGVLVETGGRVVLVRRGVAPKAGYWSLPAGYVEAHERAEEAAVRETREETGLEIEVDELLGVYSFGQEPQTGVLILYSGHTTGGELRAGDDAQQVQAFAPEELPPDDQIAFRTHRQALHDWRRARAILYQESTPDARLAIAELLDQHPSIGHGCLNYLGVEDRGMVLAWDASKLVGIACVSHSPLGQSASIDQIYVLPGYRRWGIGTRLVGQAIDYARKADVRTLLAEAPVTNPILMVYLKSGFRVSGFIDSFYPPAGGGPVTAMFLAYDLG